MAYFTFGDDLDDGVNVAKEKERFVFIDKQLYGMFTIFGDGIISGWQLSAAADNFSVNVSPGYGFVFSTFAQTDTVESVDNLPKNTTVFIYVEKENDFLTINRNVVFKFTTTYLASKIYLGTVTTNEQGVINITANTRNDISFLQLIRDEVANHKHRGTPTKIDLQTEVKNQLSGARVEDFDAAKIVSGKISPARIPQLDHSDLEGKGLLTHAALDSFARTITEGNKELLGEVAAVNTMKLVTMQHYLASKSKMNLSDYIDYTNMFVFYPGVTPDAGIDFQASNANINLLTNCVSGKPVEEGSITSIFYDSNQAFASAHSRYNVAIAKNQVSLIKGGLTITKVENFENVVAKDKAIPTFNTSTEIDENNISVLSDDSLSFKTEGIYSGKFNTKLSYKILFTKEVLQNKDWTTFNELVLDVKSITLTHGPVYMYIVNTVNGVDQKSGDYVVLGADEITQNFDPNMQSFERRAFDISSIARNNITKIVFYTPDFSSGQIFWIDNITIRSRSLYPIDGYLRLRHNSVSPVVFNAVFYEAEIPDGCDLRVRVRVANSEVLLERQPYSTILNSGDVFALSGTNIEIEILFLSNSDKTKTPVLQNLELQILTASDVVGFTINESSRWNRGSYLNAEIVADEINPLIPSLTIKSPVEVNDLYFIYENGVNQLDNKANAHIGFRGLQFDRLISPTQAYSIIYAMSDLGFVSPRSVYRTFDKHFLIADTSNDRVIEVTQNGEFIRGLGGHNVSDEFFYAISACFNPRTGILSICFTKNVDRTDCDITKIKLWIDSSPIYLSDADTLLTTSKKASIFEILLSNDKVEQLQDNTIDLYLQFESGLFREPLTYPTEGNLRKLYTVRGLQSFIGDFTYVNSINHPVYFNILSNGEWIVCNAGIVAEPTEGGITKTISLEVGKTTTFTLTIDPPIDPETAEPITDFQVTWAFTAPPDISNLISLEADNNKATVNIGQPAENQIGDWTVFFTAQPNVGDVQTTTLKLTIIPVVVTAPVEVNISPLVQFNFETAEETFTFDQLEFSEFTLGSAYEVDHDTLLIAGLYTTTDKVVLPETSGGQTLEEQAIQKLANYGGKVILYNKSRESIDFEYISSENVFPSDAVIDANNYVVIAESAIKNNAGRVIKIDQDQNVVWQLSDGSFSFINDVRAKYNGDVVIST